MSTENQLPPADDETHDAEATNSLASENGDESTVQTALSTKPKRKRGLIIGAGAAAVLAVAAFVGIPPAMHGAQVAAYQEAVGETDRAKADTAQAETDAAQLRALTALQLDEAGKLQANLEKLGATDKAVIPEAQTKALETAAAELKEALPKATDQQKKVTADLAAWKKKEENKQATEALPKTWIGATANATAPFAAQVEKPAATQKLADADVNKASVSAAEEARDAAKKTLKTAKGELADEQEQNANVTEAVAAVLPVINETAKALPKQAEAIVAAQTKGGDANAKVTNSAKSAADFAGASEFVADKGVVSPKTKDAKGEKVKLTDAHRTWLTVEKVQAYVAASAAATQAHADAVAAEAAAAAAVEAAAQGYVSDGAGGWVDPGYTGGGGGGWVDPGYTGGGGGGWSGGGSGGGGGGGYVPPVDNGGGGGGGYVPPVDNGGGGGNSCPAPPAGWFPDGGSNGGCPTYSPPFDDWG